MARFLNKEKLQLGIIILSVILSLVIVVALFVINSNNNEYSLEIEVPELIDDCWATVNGKKSTEANLKVGQKIVFGFGCSPKTGNDTRMILTLDEEFSDILEIDNHTVTAIGGGDALVRLEILFPGSQGGKATITFPVSVKVKKIKDKKPAQSKPKKPSSSKVSSLTSDDEDVSTTSKNNTTSTSSKLNSSTSSKVTSSSNKHNSSLTSSKISSSTSSKPETSSVSSKLNSSTSSKTETSSISSEQTSTEVSKPVEKENICEICGKKIDEAFNHELLECLNHYRCEPNIDTSIHTMAPCGEHLLCDNENHELRSCFMHYECDKEFESLPCGHCSCEHDVEQPCE